MKQPPKKVVRSEVRTAPPEAIPAPQLMQEILGCLPAVLYKCGLPPSFPTVFVSENVGAQFGYEPAEFYEDPYFWTKHVHDADRPRVLEKLANIGRKNSVRYEYRFRRKSGEYAWLHDQISVLRDSSGQIIGLVGSWFDISDRKKLEILQSGQSQILDSLAKRRSLEETLEQIVFMLEGLNPDMICSILRFDSTSQTLHHGAAPSLPEEYNRQIDGIRIGPTMGSCGTAAFRRECVIVTDIQTDPLWADFRHLASTVGLRACWSQPIFSSSQQLLGTTALYYCHKRGPTADELALIEQAAGLAGLAIERYHEEEAARHSERLASLGSLAAGIAHEINNPVAAIQLAAQGAIHALSTGDLNRVRDLLQNINADTERCTRIVRGVLQFGRLKKSQKQRALLRDVVRMAVHLTQGYAAERNAVVEVSPAMPGAHVFGDVVELEQVFVNVLRNAIESKPKGARIAIALIESTDIVRVSVTDNGIGMTPEQTARVFDPFFTTRQNQGGTGLGMSIVHGIVTNHGGDIRIQSRPKHGTTVVISLPRLQEHGTSS